MDVSRISIVVSMVALITGAIASGYAFNAVSSLASDIGNNVVTVRSDVKTASDRVNALSSDLQSVRRSTETITAEEKAIRVLVETRLGGISVALEEANKKLADAEKARISESQRVAILEKELARTKMIEAARAEGKLVVYSVSSVTSLEAIGRAFKARYGIEQEFFRGADQVLAQKLEAEVVAGKAGADVAEMPGDLALWFKEKGWQMPYRNPVLEIVPKHYWLDDTGYFTPVHENPTVWAFNTKIVTRADVKSYSDLLNPKWKGKIAIPDPFVHPLTASYLYTMRDVLGNQFNQWVKGIYVDQQPLTVVSLTPVAKAVSTGEVALGPTVLSPLMVEFDNKGPINALVLPPWITRPTQVAILKNAPHPNAAKLYLEFLVSKEAQEIRSKVGQTPILPGVPSPVERLGVVQLLEGVKVLKQSELDPNALEAWRAELKKIMGR